MFLEGRRLFYQFLEGPNFLCLSVPPQLRFLFFMFFLYFVFPILQGLDPFLRQGLIESQRLSSAVQGRGCFWWVLSFCYFFHLFCKELSRDCWKNGLRGNLIRRLHLWFRNSVSQVTGLTGLTKVVPWKCFWTRYTVVAIAKLPQIIYHISYTTYNLLSIMYYLLSTIYYILYRF